MNIKQELIERALALTGKTMEDMEVFPTWYDGRNDKFAHYELEFSVEKFCYYLQSPEFIDGYWAKFGDDVDLISYPMDFIKYFGNAIYAYHEGNEELLEELLSEIK